MKILFPSFQRRRSVAAESRDFPSFNSMGNFQLALGDWPQRTVKILLGGRWNNHLTVPAPPCMCFNGVHCGVYDDILIYLELLKEPPRKKKNWIPYRFSKYWISHWQISQISPNHLQQIQAYLLGNSHLALENHHLQVRWIKSTINGPICQWLCNSHYQRLCEFRSPLVLNPRSQERW